MPPTQTHICCNTLHDQQNEHLSIEQVQQTAGIQHYKTNYVQQQI